jgi:transposase-like protein
MHANQEAWPLGHSEKRAQVVACLIEGNSIRATVRMTGVAKNTVPRLVVDLGTACTCTGVPSAAHSEIVSTTPSW